MIDVKVSISGIIEDGNVYFFCIKKDDIIKINGPSFNSSKKVITDKDCMCEEELTSYMDKEMGYLHERINLLRLFTLGNVGFRDAFSNILLLNQKFLLNGYKCYRYNVSIERK